MSNERTLPIHFSWLGQSNGLNKIFPSKNYIVFQKFVMSKSICPKEF